MPKSAKRRKEKAADFAIQQEQKAKLKLGKGKQAPSNAIDTSFKARSIALPSQSIAVEKDDSAPTTRRKLSLDDLIVNIKHHNPGTRKDTIFGFRELLDAHWELIDSSLPILINVTVRIIGDEDASVRKALLSFYSWLIPRIPKEDLVPHAPLILLFTTSAQTHIFPEIRIDAIRFLNIFLEYFPEVIVRGWDTANNSSGSRVLEGYLGVLSAGTITGDAEGPPVATSTASVMLTPASKLVVLQSLSRFLEAATGIQSTLLTSEDFWFLSPSFHTTEAYITFNRLLRPSSTLQSLPHKAWSLEMEPEADIFPIASAMATHTGNLSCQLQELSDHVVLCRNFCELGASTSSGNPFVVRLAKTLHPTLVSVFLDCAPAVFSPSNGPPETETDSISAVVSITRTLYGLIMQDSSPASAAIEELQIMLGYMAPFFPFHSNGRKDVKIEQTFQDLNFTYCDLTSRLVPASRTSAAASHPTTSRGKKARHFGNDASQANRVQEYVLEILQEQVSSSQLVRGLTSTAYNSLLPTIWSLLNYSGRNEEQLERSGEVLEAVVEHAVKVGSKSALKRSTFDFVARLVLLETDVRYQGAFRLQTSTKADKLIEEWLTQLPQILWELGSSNPSVSEAIILFLLRLLQRRSKILHENTLASLQTRFAPYFHITHPTRGEILGPFNKLPKNGLSSPSGLRRRVLDVVILLCTGGSSGEVLRSAVDSALVNTEEYEYWAHLKHHFGRSQTAL
ncbi:uncharacterized protein C8R40DRAFT_1165590 [Lentinula edodes]|uniref:uncharacterized protein n=1 Tax=Lentinula edodes TaxID=5353 RepID=UPI001E8D0680|nr:uncharacterized protein C8R40DRAFT_1165590 [Lentinula edodes]KAH7880643.1 hypothetical protein C8R40DRAFT_1165590 [Lentinula edodes]